MATHSYEELVDKLQKFEIDHLQFVMLCPEHKDDFINWCKMHNCRPNADTAEYYINEVCITAEEQQELIHDNYEW